MKVDIRVVLCLASLFSVGDTSWCEQCGGGGFGEDVKHRDWCRLAKWWRRER